jgi:hypothetical protein
LTRYLDPRPLLGLAVLLSITSCSHGSMPVWHGKTWAGDSARAGITRAQDSLHIDATDPQFDNYVAMTYEDLKELFGIVWSCKQWPMGMEMMSAQEALARYQLMVLDLERQSKVK